MKLQYAMDTFSMEEALDKVNCLLGVVDVFEIGTPMLLRYGLEAVRTLRARYPRPACWPTPKSWMVASWRLTCAIKLVQTSLR